MPSHSVDDFLAQALANTHLSPPPPWRSHRPLQPTIPLLSLTRPNITLTLTPPSPTSTTQGRQYPINQPPASPNLLTVPKPGSRKRQRSQSSPSPPTSPTSPLPPSKKRRVLFGEITSTRSLPPLPPPRHPAHTLSRSLSRASQSPQRLRRRPGRLSLVGPAHPQLSVSGGLASGLPVRGRQPGAEERRGAGGERGARDERR